MSLESKATTCLPNKTNGGAGKQGKSARGTGASHFLSVCLRGLSRRDCVLQPKGCPPSAVAPKSASLYGALLRRTGEERATPGSVPSGQSTLKGLKHRHRSEQILASSPLGLIRAGTFSQGSSFLATLIGVPKLFIGGEESFPLSPQPTVNNFARRSNRFCEQDCRRAEWPAVTPRWMTNAQPVSLDESAQSFAPARRLGPRRILRCRQQNVSAIRPSLGPSQRARNSKSRQP